MKMFKYKKSQGLICNSLAGPRLVDNVISHDRFVAQYEAGSYMQFDLWY